MINVAYTNIKSKANTNDLLSDPLTLILVFQVQLRSMLLYNSVAEVLVNFINSDKRIKGIRIKIVNFTDNITIFLRHITCLDRIQVTLRLYEKAKIN